ncbi:MAG: class I SAM-dependent methyltransferase [Pelagibacterales bacterium]|nr:class I SAM-dependent methyltransferase [Pelagibacterales bacterium]
MKVFWERFDKGFLRNLDVLQFSDDPAVDGSWFNKYLLNIFGAENSIDIQKIDKPSESYDIVLCNQVIEHVPDDRSSLKELMRVTKKNGFVQLGVPYPMEIEKTIDWGYPNELDHGHYRNYGRDICYLLDELIGKNKWLEIRITDPVTKAQDFIYILCHTIGVMAKYKKIIYSEI